jgi:hypothetical protein
VADLRGKLALAGEIQEPRGAERDPIEARLVHGNSADGRQHPTKPCGRANGALA